MVDRTENGTRTGAEEEIRLLDLGTIVLKRWRTVLGTTAGAVVVALVVALILPESYTARTVLLSPSGQADGRAQLIASQLAGLPLPGLASSTNANQRLIGVIAKSRVLADSMVRRLGAGEGESESEEVIRRVLSANTGVESNADGSVVVEVSAEDRQLAARIANEFPGVINSIAATIGAQAAVRKREFLENQLAHARDKLIESEQQMIEFQERRGAPEIQDQARRTVDAAARLQQQIIETEVEVAQLRRTATADNPQLRAAVAELNARREQLRRLTDGTRGGDRFFLSLGESPELKVASARLLREFTKNEQIYVSLTAALVDTQIEADNNLPVVSVLDSATVPGRSSAPNLPLIVAVAAVLGLVVGLIAAFVGEALRSARRDPHSESFFAAWNQFKVDIARYLPHRWRRRPRLPLHG